LGAIGNCSTTDVENILRDYYNAIKSFFEDEQAAFLSLS